MVDAIMANGFCELSDDEMAMVDGGSWQKVLAGVTGCVLIANAPVIGIATGVGASVVGTPVVGIAAGVGAAAGVVSAGASCLDYCTK